MGGKQSSETKNDQGEGPTLSETRYRPDDSPVVIPESLQPPFSTTRPPPVPPPHHHHHPPPVPPPHHHHHPPPPSPPHHIHPSSSPQLSQRSRPSASNNDLPRPRFGSAGPHRRQPAAPDLLDWDFLLADFPRPPPPPPRPPPPSHSASHRMHRSSSASLSIERERRRRRAELREQLGASATAGRLDPFSLLLRGLGRGSDTECPVCHEEVPSGDFQRHMSECARRPKLQYNEDVLRIRSGECSICLEDMSPGDTIARLPCLCVYHVKCIDEWFKVKQTCPEHPDLIS